MCNDAPDPFSFSPSNLALFESALLTDMDFHVDLVAVSLIFLLSFFLFLPPSLNFSLCDLVAVSLILLFIRNALRIRL